VNRVLRTVELVEGPAAAGMLGIAGDEGEVGK
jgi:hypothetical protein